MGKDFSKLKREIRIMPDFVQTALRKSDVMEAYHARPPYQQNDYLAWIERAKREETREKRLQQMIEELKSGGRYMNMHYHSKI